MGTLAKRLGQFSRRSLETESANILKTAKANKIPGSLSLALDGTLKKGHDMKVFGLGTLASMASRERYQRFTRSMYHIYSTMEDELDKSETPALDLVWKKHGDVLRRSASLYSDLKDVSSPEELERLDCSVKSAGDSFEKDAILSGPTRDYVDAIRMAAQRDREEGGASLIGHLYCRYFADLFGGQMLGLPYNVALRLNENTPCHYNFEFGQVYHDRRHFIEAIYSDINEAGQQLRHKQREAVVDEALTAFRHNIRVYTEEPVWGDSLIATSNLLTGFVARSLRSK